MSEQEEILESLKQAIEITPANPILRNQYGKMLLSRGRTEEALDVYKKGLELTPDNELLQIGLAESYQRTGKTSVSLVILEDLMKRPNCAAEAYLLYAKALLSTGQLDGAEKAYRQAIALKPALKNQTLEEALNLPPKSSELWNDPDVDSEGRIRMPADAEEDFMFTAMEKPDTTFADVGGMDKVKDQIRLKIIEPLKNPSLYSAYGKKVGGGILLYGPPGCGKTYIARATAGQADAVFIPVGLHDILDMYIGSSEQKLHALFEFAREKQPSVLFFDEVDALGASRTDMRRSAGRHLINQFLSELDGIDSKNDGLLILAATNAPWHIDPAFRRPGRFDRMIFVPPPDNEARIAILRILLRDKPQTEINYGDIAKKTDSFSGADLKALVDQAIEAKLNKALKTGIPEPLSTKDLLAEVKSIKPTCKQWFATAKNYALYSNQSGVYDDIVDYLDLR